MSFEKLIIVAMMATLACANFCSAKPTPRAVELSDAVNRTVCPIEVTVDEDPDRIPRRIKLLKCAPNPNKWCIEQRIPSHECCAHNHNHHVMECVEIHDKVLVKYPNSEDPNKTKIYDVAVGCTCMVGRANSASTLPPPP